MLHQTVVVCASMLVFQSWKSVVDHVTARALKCFSLQDYNYLHGAVTKPSVAVKGMNSCIIVWSMTP